MTQKSPSLFDWNIVGPAIGDSFKKLNPRLMIKNPVMFVTMVGAALTTVGIFTASADRGFIAQLALWLWFTVLFANLPKQSPRVAAKLRPTPFARPAKIRSPVACVTGVKKKPPPLNCRKGTSWSARQTMSSLPMGT